MDKIKLGDCATFINGYAFKPEDWNTEGLPIIRIQNLNNENAPYNYYNKNISKQYIVENGDILISWSGSIGVFEWKNGQAVLNQHIFKVVFDKIKINKQYFVYLINTRLAEMIKNTHGSTMKHITKTNFDNLVVCLHDLQTQQKIVEELDCLSDIIEKKKQQLADLDNLIKSQFIEMFDNLTNTAKLVDVCKFINGDRGKNYPSGSDIVKKGIPFINAGHLENNSISFSEMNYLTEEKFNLLSSGKVQKNDVLYCLRGSLGKKAIVTFNKGAIASSLVILRPNTEKINPKFLLYTLEQPYIDAQMKNSNNGSSQPNLSAQSVKQYNIILPKIELQNKFADFVENIEKSKNDIKQSIEQTQNLFNERMQHYFGE